MYLIYYDYKRYKVSKRGDTMLEIDGFKLTLAIAECGLSAVELAEKSGVAQVTIARFKAGTQKARPQTICKLAKALNVKVEALVKEDQKTN